MRSENRGNYEFKDRRRRGVDSLALEQLQGAIARIGAIIPCTPMKKLEISLSGVACRIDMKDETGLPTGSFKVRGALNFIEQHAGNRGAEFVAASTGNHGLGLAWAAQRYGCKVTVVVPVGTLPSKLDRLEELSADVITVGNSLDESIAWARKSCLKSESKFIASFDPDVILGHATLGAELFSTKDHAPIVCFPVGIGSGISGIAVARDLLSPETTIVGVVPESCQSWIRSWRAGKPIRSGLGHTTAQGLRTECPDRDLLSFLKPRLRSIISVTEDEIAAAKKILGLGSNSDSTGAVGAAGAIQIARVDRATHISTVLCG